MLVDVILPVPMVGMLTYNVPFEMAADALVGCRVLVPLGKKIETGIIVGISTAEDSDISYRDVVCMLDDSPLLSARDLLLWQWVAEYYMCSLGDVMRAALPALLKLESTTRVRLETEDTDLHLTPQQQTIYNILSDGKEHDVQEIARRLQIRSAMPALSKMIRAGIVCTTEDVTDKYRPKYEDYVVLHTDQDLQAVLDSLSRAPQQQSTFLEFLELSHYGELPVSKRQLKPTGLKALIDKQILSVERQRVGRQQQCDSTQTLHTLT
jgi:primosomal protein N' (replication factor Y)